MAAMKKGGGADNRREPDRIAGLAIESPDEKCTEILSIFDNAADKGIASEVEYDGSGFEKAVRNAWHSFAPELGACGTFKFEQRETRSILGFSQRAASHDIAVLVNCNCTGGVKKASSPVNGRTPESDPGHTIKLTHGEITGRNLICGNAGSHNMIIRTHRYTQSTIRAVQCADDHLRPTGLRDTGCRVQTHNAKMTR
jgi:hypothetical protein